jgi:methylmalonyl-CoA mutase cobalamin-binding subunit
MGGCKKMKRGKILGAAIGNCIHVAGLMNFLALAEQEGYTTVFIGSAVPIQKLVQSIKEQDPDIVAVSYRLTDDVARELFIELKQKIQQHNLLSKKFILGGTPPVVERGKEIGIFDATFSGAEALEDVVRYLKGTQRVSEASVKYPQTLPEYIEWKYPMPLIRHHFGQPSLEETVKGAKEIAESKVLDILSIAPDQNAQEHFFHPDEMDPKLDGAGGVPIRKPEDLEAIYSATRCGNYPLVRCYAGTRDLVKWAQMLVETINIAWGAVPLCWYSELDGRSKRPVLDAIKENQEAIRWYAQHGVPVEVNESHQWALRNTSDTIEVVTAFIAAYNAKKLGVRHYVMQYMFNTPPGISPEMDLAKMLAKVDLIETLHDESFVSYRMVRTGLASLSPDPDIAKGQLAYSLTISMALKPHIVHVVGYSEGEHAATAKEIIESCKIAKGVIQNCLIMGLPDIASSINVKRRKEELVREASVLLEAIKKIAGEDVNDPWTDPGTISRSIEIGLLDAPHLKGNKYARGELTTRIVDGACYAVNPETNKILTEEERVAEILERV